MSNLYVLLTWQYSKTDETGYFLQRSTNSGSTWPVDYTLPIQNQYLDFPTPVETYWYRVTATNDVGSSPFSNVASVTFPEGPHPSTGPSDLVVVSGSAILTWTSQSNDLYFFAIQRSLDGIGYSDFADVLPSSVDVNIVSNGGFETGDTGSWNIVDLSEDIFVVAEPTYVHSGTYGCKFGPYITAENPNGSGSLSQILDTISGSYYTLSFWFLSNGTTDPLNFFQVYWEGNLIADLSAENNPYTQYIYPVTASMNGSELLFLGDNEPDYYGLDDISVTTSSVILLGTYTDTTVTSSILGSTYWYQVAAVNGYGTSSFSNTASITFTLLIPPSGAISLTVASSSLSASLIWTYMDTNQNGFNVERSTDGVTYSNLISIANPTSRSYDDLSVSSPNTYWYRVDAYNGAGTSSYSNTGSAEFPPVPTWNAWWTMDTASFDSPNPFIHEIDSINGLDLALQLNSFFSTTGSGKVNNALIFTGSSGTSLFSTCNNASLKFSSIGTTVVCWVKAVDDISKPDTTATLLYRFDQSGSNYNINVSRNGGGSDWVLTLGAATINKAWAADWHFFAITFDAVTGNISFDIDRAATTTQFAVIPGAGANTYGFAFVACSGGVSGGQITVFFDEFAIYNRVLNSTQLDYLYNSGTGRTWPVTLP